jgi:succinyl-diaminopimelate desuccinylase
MTQTDLLAATARLVDIPSVSHHETTIADLVERELHTVAHLDICRLGDNVVARTHLGRNLRVILAGHLDTVPPAGNNIAVLDGDRLHGCGAADMKGGLAVMLELARQVVDPSADVTFVFYACEEVERAFSGLKYLGETRPDLLVGDVAIVLEPTRALVEAGCQGVLRIGVTLKGKRAHSARPWTGINAVHRLGPVLDRVAAFVERQPILDGCRYHETLQAVQVLGGVAGNVVPDECSVLLSHRFAPDRTSDEAYAAVIDYLTPAINRDLGDTTDLRDVAPAAPPALDHPVLRSIVAASGAAATAKIAWTDVALFAERGIPAANFGPGDPLVAHSAGEFVDRSEIERVFTVLKKVLSESATL